MYYNNANAVYFDNIQLYKEEFEDSYQYDAKGNLVSTTDLAKQNSTFEYNTNNDLIKAVSPKGGQFTYSYDSKHNILSATSGENVVYSFTYDVYGNPITSKVGDSTLFLQSEAKYNSDGNNVTNGNYITELKAPSGNVVKYNYNQTKGTLDSLTDAKGKVTSYKYDSNLDRLESVSKTVDGNIITNSYTYENDRIKTINHNGFSYVFNYDSFGNVESVYVGTQKLVNNTYDSATGNLNQVTYGNGQNVSNEYDDLDRVTTEKYNGTPRYNYQYDGSGNLGYHEDLVNGINYRYIYDISDRLVKVVDSKGNTSSYGYDPNNNNISYTYDAIGRVKTSTITIGTSQYVTTYDYDNGGRLNKVILPGGKTIAYTHDANSNIETVNDGGKNTKYYYNELNELIREDNEVLDKTIVYSYDAGGNILSKTEYTYTTGTPGTATKTYTYEYGDANWKDMLTAFDGKAITYDAIGNPLTYDGYSYTWEEGRQLKSIEKDGLNISFKYNSAGIRTEKNVNGVVTKYHVVGDKVTFESNGTDNIYYTYDSSDNLISMNLNGVEYYYVRNGQGDITGLLDGSGNQVVSYTYDAWGKAVAVEGSLKDSVGVKNPYRYRGYRLDSETGLYYLNSRYYNPEWGRFINADAITGLTGALLSHNMFAYCSNNPVNDEDSDGYLSNKWKIAIGIAAIAAGVVATVATGGAAAPALIGSLQYAASSAAIGAGIGATYRGVSTAVKGGSLKGIGKSMLKGAIDGAADGFMTGGIGAGGMQLGRAALSKAGYGFKIGKSTEALYATPNTRGGTIISRKSASGTKFRVDLDSFNGLHYHLGKGRAAKVHKTILPWKFGNIR